MGEVLGLKKVKLMAVVAAAALALGCSLSLGTSQSAYADEGLQAGSMDLTTQMQEPEIKAAQTVTLFPNGTKTLTIKDTVEGQTGEWSLKNSKAAVASAKLSSDTDLTTKLTVKALKAGKTKITLTFTTDAGKTASKVVNVTTAKTWTKTVKKTGNQKTYQWVAKKNVTLKSAKMKKGNKSLAVIKKGQNIYGTTYKVTGISAKAFSKNCAKLKVLRVKSPYLTKASVKNSLQGSSVAKVAVPKAKFAQYKNFFTKANCGKQVKVVKGTW